MLRSSLRALRRKSLALLLVLALLLPIFPRQSHAVWIPPCEAYECPAGAGIFWAIHSAIMLFVITLLEGWIATHIGMVTSAFNGTANADTMNADAENRSDSTNMTNESIVRTANTLAQERIGDLLETSPSVSVCQVATRRLAVLSANSTTRSQARMAESAINRLLSNDPATPAATGQAGYLSARFTARMAKYCNPATTNAPASVGCTATIGVDRDLSPYQSIFSKADLSAPADYEAAKDVVLNLVGDNVVTTIRGAALARPQGQLLSLKNYSDQARVNLAASVLSAMVERRRDASGSGKTEAVAAKAASYTDSSLERLAFANASQGSSQTMDTITLLMGETSKQMLDFRQFMERWATLRAVGLAMDIQDSGAKGVTTAGRVMGN